MSSPKADAQFLRGVLVVLLFATAVSFAGAVFSLLAVPSPPAAMTISYAAP